MDKMTYVSIASQRIPVRLLTGEELRGLWAAVIVNYNVYSFSFQEEEMLLLQPKRNSKSSPTVLANIASRIEQVCGKPCIFYFENGKTFERDRLIKQGVYFIVNSQYCFLPTLLMNRKIPKVHYSGKFTPMAQRIVLFHLQKESLDGKSYAQISEAVGYKYASVARSVGQLEQLGIVQTSAGDSGIKTVHFPVSGKELWQKIREFLINPVKRIIYTDRMLPTGIIGSINALSHYTRLNADEVATRVFTLSEWNSYERENEIFTSESEDLQPIEIWKYEPLTEDGYADRLSLALSLEDDHDPRVEKEVEYMIDQIKW